MSKKRIKAKAYPVPTTREEAEQLLGAIGSMQSRVGEYEAKAAARILGIKQAFAELAAPVNEQIEGAFQALHAWAETNRSQLCKGDIKTVKFATGTLSWRFTPLAVKLGKIDQVIAELEHRELERFLRISKEVDKEALLRCYNDDTDGVIVDGIPGIKFTSREEFVAKPLESQIERVETVAPTKARRAA